MAAKLDTAEITFEHTHHTEGINARAFFETKPPEDDDSPVEDLTLDARTWQAMGYPHFVTVSIKTTK